MRGYVSALLLLLTVMSQAEDKPQKNPADAMRGLRMMWLTTPPGDLGGLKPTPEFPRVYAVLMDWPVGKNTATVAASSGGDASIFTTSTFGILGGVGHETVRAAAAKLVKLADKFYDDAQPTKEFPYPAADRVRFYLLTFTGVRVIDTDMASIQNGQSKFTALFAAGQDVLTELRLVSEEHDKETGK